MLVRRRHPALCFCLLVSPSPPTIGTPTLCRAPLISPARMTGRQGTPMAASRIKEAKWKQNRQWGRGALAWNGEPPTCSSAEPSRRHAGLNS
ncbi:hypothetical protein J3F83DRAFT_732297 [Trichoderma novae-zelandiae]